MTFDVEAYIIEVDGMTISQLRAEKNRVNREWSSHTTKQYKHGFSSIFTGPFGVYKSLKYGSLGIDAAKKSDIVDAHLEDLELYSPSRVRDFAIGAGAAVAAVAAGDWAGELADGTFDDVDPDHRYRSGEKLASKGIELGVEKGGEKLVERAAQSGGRDVQINEPVRICDGCLKDGTGLAADEGWLQCFVCDYFMYCPTCFLDKRFKQHPRSHEFFAIFT